MQPNELFLSYSTLDHAFANSIVNVLRRHAIPVWHSATALIVSPHAVDSMWVRRELLFVLEDRRLNDKIVPLLYPTCDYKRFCGPFHPLR